METFDGTDLSEAQKSCERILGYRFRDRDLLKMALTHASCAINRLGSNERLEFLGDALLGLIVCEQLYQELPCALEGELTKVKSAVVSRRACAHLSKELGLGDLLFLGRGMIGRRSLPVSLQAAVFESLIGAIYVDSDFQTVRNVVLRLIRPLIDEVSNSQLHHNFKSQLQQYAQRELEIAPVYELLDEKGPDHSKCFEICARLGDKCFPSAWGPNKKEAEQQAARQALIKLGLLDDPDN